MLPINSVLSTSRQVRKVALRIGEPTGGSEELHCWYGPSHFAEGM